VPQSEKSAVAGYSAYGICKAAATQWVATMAKDFAVCVRPFNQIGPHQSPRFAVASFAHQIAAIARGEAAPILRVGNLDVERDFIHVADSSLAHIMALEKGEPGQIYNIASGEATCLRILVDHMIALSGVRIDIEVDPARLRTGDLRRIVGDATKLRAATGWKAKCTAFDAAADALRANMDETEAKT
jgi:GDP-4-dehydro-6-deoxy-D-mannose reductase